MNLLASLTQENLAQTNLRWEHDPLKWEPLSGGGMRVYVPAQVDYFQDPAGKVAKDDAPYLWMKCSGDFVAQAHVRPAHTSTYDAAAILARQDATHWGKLCFESTDFGTRAAVSVVTNGVSDDANGVDLSVTDLWLQMARAGDVFAMHYSLDGSSWRMVRLFRLAVARAIRVGLVAQCPVGPGATVDFLYFNVENRTLQNLRGGI